MNPAEMGRVKKIEKAPPGHDERLPQGVLHHRAEDHARIRGAPSYSNFFIRYPMTPKMTMMMTSSLLLLRL